MCFGLFYYFRKFFKLELYKYIESYIKIKRDRYEYEL